MKSMKYVKIVYFLYLFHILLHTFGPGAQAQGPKCGMGRPWPRMAVCALGTQDMFTRWTLHGHLFWTSYLYWHQDYRTLTR